MDLPTHLVSDNESKPCYFCGLLGTWDDPKSWDDFSSAAQDCKYCEVIFKGCVGWLDATQTNFMPSLFFMHYRFDGHFNAPNNKDPIEYDKTRNIAEITSEDGRRVLVEIFPGLDEEGNVQVPETWIPKTMIPFKTFNHVSNFTGSAETRAQIKAWLDQCTTTHVKCNDQSPRRLPRRLIHVGQCDEEVRLVEHDEVYGQYLALSHCWGNGEMLKTTQLNLPENLSSIEFSKLPLTFQEAIKVTRFLGQNYLWIDSLCILQDDREDWSKEAAKMCDYYRNALLTIAATASEHGGQGLYRSTINHEDCGVDRDGHPYRLIYVEYEKHAFATRDAYFDTLKRLPPLAKRAWIYQERMLSRRMLYFGTREVSFDCIQTYRCQCLPPNESWDLKFTPNQPRSVFHSKSNQMATLDRMHLWHKMVQEYSRLEMTFLSDKLPAFSALAKQISQYGGARYLAGLWEDTLIDDLLWSVYWMDLIDDPRESTWRAPSWSWASVKTAVKWSAYEHYQKREAISDMSPDYIAVVVSCNVVKKTTDMFGELESAALQLLGYCVDVKMSSESGHDGVVLEFDNGVLCDFNADCREEVFKKEYENAELACFLMAEPLCLINRSWPFDGERTAVPFWLVLRRLKRGADVFERIGVCFEWVSHPRTYDRTELFATGKKLITII